ncbi:AAA family ATPase [Thioalkalivibrio sulfidiphilus]|uniref:AAA family ATPase n=1 Tax=Thioalkalivibrio sulfidiphilus TaxID=1033854 RepID=UPI0003810CB3|nr:AAA family ATPase [Thioalkalivibrio sulfidiphilus]
MYLEYFNLDKPPFQLAPDSSFLYMSKPHARALAYMKYTVMNRDGFAVVTGEIGSGKTIVLQRLLDSLDDSVVVARIHQTQLTEVEFLEHLATVFGIDSHRSTKVELIEKLNRFLANQAKRRRSVLLVVDECQNLSRDVLEEIRMLSDGEPARNKVLSVILVGQPELADLLADPSLEQLSQRIRLRFHLRPLGPEEIAEYIRHRLEVAGWQGQDLFPAETIELIHRYTGGIPRLINVFCDTVLLAAFVEQTSSLTQALIESAAEELQWAPYAQRHAPVLPAPAEQTHPPESAAAPRPVAREARLIITLKTAVLSTHAVTGDMETIGRTSACRIQLAHMSVSRKHAAILKADEHYFVVDLNSRNGIAVNGERVERRLLKDGDRIAIGCYQLHFYNPTANRSAAGPRNDDTLAGERSLAAGDLGQPHDELAAS